MAYVQRLKEIFGKDRATGNNAEDVIDVVNDLLQEDNRTEFGIDAGDYHPTPKDIYVDDDGVNSVCHNEQGEAVNKSSGKGKKRKASDSTKQVVELLGEISRATNARLETLASRIGYDYDLDQAKTHFCEMFADKPDCLVIFKGLPESTKPHYVQRLLKSKPT